MCPCGGICKWKWYSWSQPDRLLNKTFFFPSCSSLWKPSDRREYHWGREWKGLILFSWLSLLFVPSWRSRLIVGLSLSFGALVLTASCAVENTCLSRWKTAYLDQIFQPPYSDNTWCWFPTGTNALFARGGVTFVFLDYFIHWRDILWPSELFSESESCSTLSLLLVSSL